MMIYYIATRAKYVLVDAASEADAIEQGRPKLEALYAECLGRTVPIEIHTVRPATGDEIKLERWNQQMIEREAHHA